jgi:threonine dehydratase
MLIKELLPRILTARVYDLAVQTPLSVMGNLSAETGATVWLKREDQQPVFSFKLRGAANKLAHLTEAERKAGVIAASAGNHAQGVALSAKHYHCAATIVMPLSTPSIKVEAVKAMGAKVVLHGDGYDESCTHALKLAKETGATFIHPFDDYDVIAGQGTIAMEIVQQCPRKPAAVFVPVGGGGLVAGIGAYIKSVMPDVRVIGVEPEGAATLATSLKAGKRVVLDKIDRFADGVAVREVGELTFKVAQACVDEVILVSADEICTAVRDTFEGVRAIVEPSGALALAGLRKYAQKHDVKGKDLVAIASGANVNFDRFGSIVERAELGAGGEILLAVTIPERPGSFLEFCRLIGKRNISEFNYRFSSNSEAQVLAGIRLRGGTKEREKLIQSISAAGLPVCDLTDNEMAKHHVRHMVGGRANTPERERLYRFEFPERSGALVDFLTTLAGRWSISLFHYRNHGSAYGNVLVGMMVPEKEDKVFQKFLEETGFEFQDETANPAYAYFLQPEAQHQGHGKTTPVKKTRPA